MFIVSIMAFSEIFAKKRIEILRVLRQELELYKYERYLMEEGRREGQELVARLILKLLEQNRLEDLNRAAKDLEYRKKLFQEFEIRREDIYEKDAIL